MIGWLIVACEIGFWVLILIGLFTRYILKRKKLGAIFLWSTPIIDLLLIIATVIDLQNGQTATFFHGLAAYYIGMTAAFGHQLIDWADKRFAYRYSNGPKPMKKAKYGAEYAKNERKGWYRHLLGWVIGNVLLLGIIYFVGDKTRTEVLWNVIKLWGLVLSIDFAISFSYTIFPKSKAKGESL
ncbi:hypothetical protein CVD28_18810 [Bacillus sp. M6-12]|uniref:2TM domain-containing protein n=1 Tax=Bacillus sp. M6-12 TaxID=2054166 RepID=UPI000C75695A|nr:2TM domain-containing protein [Bacillus sp. M6-12]PLS16096.1 hypothetical protein CVD28_18810 [Bacillus sp. M6-12]